MLLSNLAYDKNDAILVNCIWNRRYCKQPLSIWWRSKLSGLLWVHESYNWHVGLGDAVRYAHKWTARLTGSCGAGAFWAWHFLIRVFPPCPSVDVGTWVTASSPTAENEHLRLWFRRLNFVLVESHLRTLVSRVAWGSLLRLHVSFNLRRSLGGHSRRDGADEQKRNEAVNQGKSVSGRGKNKCRGSEAGTSVTWLKKNKKASVTLAKVLEIFYIHTFICVTTFLEKLAVVMSVPSKGSVLRVTFSFRFKNIHSW